MKYGLEIEKFVYKAGILVACPPSYPVDGEGLQLEIRARPENLIRDAVAVAISDLRHYEKRLLKNGYTLDPTQDYVKVDHNLKLEVRRAFTKERLKYQNLYGHKRHAVTSNMSTAGIHLSVTDELSFVYSAYKQDEDGVKYRTSETKTYNQLWDFPQFFMYLDKAFASEIKAAKRRPGFYEIKSDGRVEYRSLPTSIDLNKLVDVVEEYHW